LQRRLGINFGEGGGNEGGGITILTLSCILLAALSGYILMDGYPLVSILSFSTAVVFALAKDAEIKNTHSDKWE